MKRSLLVSLSIAFFSLACAGTAPIATAPTPARAPVANSGAPAAAPLSLKALTSAPDNWHRLSVEEDGVLGTGSERALAELLNGTAPARRVIVAVIDGGVDTAHVLLKTNLWRNAKETVNSRDDDGNGLVDDALGWNYAGGPDLASVNHETFEVTRLYAACRGMAAGNGTPQPDAVQCAQLKVDYDDKRRELTGQMTQIANVVETTEAVTAVLQRAMNASVLTRASVTSYQPTSAQATQARNVWLQIEEAGLLGRGIEDARIETEKQITVGLDPTFDSRAIVRDSIADLNQRVYGNRDVTGPDAKHGTHVAGIIGAVRGAGPVQGIAPSVQIMAVRAVPNGDERDKDVANAIRYAVDNGANIINMSFGKSYSPGKSAVDAAARYAASKGVLMVHAAGNDGEDVDVEPSYPSPFLLDKSRVAGWIEVGASSWKGLGELAAPFSNYGHLRVDLFAPGVDILSTVPGGGTEKLSGTSMAAPVVSGVAALLMSYFPALTAADVSDILTQSARRITTSVAKPGGESRVAFGALSQTGGVIDAYAAVKLAQSRARMKQ